MIKIPDILCDEPKTLSVFGICGYSARDSCAVAIIVLGKACLPTIFVSIFRKLKWRMQNWGDLILTRRRKGTGRLGEFARRAECMEEARKHPLPLALRFRYLPGYIVGFLTFPKRDAVSLRISSGKVNKIVTCQRKVGWGGGGAFLTNSNLDT